MADIYDKRIDELPEATVIDDADLFVLEQNGVAKNVSGEILTKYARDVVADDVNRAEQAANDAESARDSAQSSATVAEEAATRDVPATVKNWLDTHITPTSPAVDSSLTVAGAAADAEAVGDALNNALAKRGTLTGENTLRSANIYLPGTYFWAADSVPSDAPVANTAGRAILLKTASITSFSAAAWLVFSGNKMFFAYCNNMAGDNWSDWHEMANLPTVQDNTLYSRGALTSSNDLYTVTNPGYYYWNANNAPAHAPNTSSFGRGLLIRGYSDGSAYWLIASAGNLYAVVHESGTSGEWGDAVNLTGVASIQANLGYDGKLNVDDLAWKVGGIESRGHSVSRQNGDRIRSVSASGLGAVWVAKGSTISLKGEEPYSYKFAVAMYSQYKSSGNFDLLDYRSIGTDPVTIQQDCYIRIMIGASDDATFWDDVVNKNDDQEKIAAAVSALEIDLRGHTVKEQIDELAGRINTSGRGVLELTEDLPATATELHALWATLEDGVTVTSEDLTDANGASIGEAFPVKMYRIRRYHHWVDTDYSTKTTDGELPARPKILLISGTHGQERAAPAFVYEFVRRMLQDAEYGELAAGNDWDVVPLVNPWGYSHSWVNTDTGTVVLYPENEGGYSHYSIRENRLLASGQQPGGIRFSSLLKDDPDRFADINRDYNDTGTGFSTPEAQMIRKVLFATKYDLVIDFHQSMNHHMNNSESSVDKRVCGFCSMNTQPPATVAGSDDYTARLSKVRRGINAAAGTTDAAVGAWIGEQVGQQSYVWKGSDTVTTFRNYAAGVSDGANGRTEHVAMATPVSLCLETSGTCYPITGSKINANPVALVYGNTFTDQVIQKVIHAIL